MTTTKKTTTRKKAASSTTKKVVATKPRVIADKIPELPTNPFAPDITTRSVVSEPMIKQ